MLDTHARQVVQPLFDRLAARLFAWRVRPVSVTLWSLGIGVMSAGCLVWGWPLGFVGLLWLSGLLDAVDGTLARLDGSASRAGALIDIVCDRIVEVAVILALAISRPDTRLALVALCAAIIVSLTVFLTAAAALPNVSNKSFHYQAGLTERTEGFVFFSLMGLWPSAAPAVTWLFALAVLITAGQRFLAAVRLFRD